MTIVWPAVIKFCGDDELLFIKDESTWLADDDLSAYAYAEDDVLVDSNSELFCLTYDVEIKKTVVKAQKKTVSVNQFETWVKNHTAVLDQCCSSKLTLSSINEGLVLVEQLSD